jgi:hypothetical protein
MENLQGNLCQGKGLLQIKYCNKYFLILFISTMNSNLCAVSNYFLGKKS